MFQLLSSELYGFLFAVSREPVFLQSIIDFFLKYKYFENLERMEVLEKMLLLTLLGQFSSSTLLVSSKSRLLIVPLWNSGFPTIPMGIIFAISIKNLWGKTN